MVRLASQLLGLHIVAATALIGVLPGPTRGEETTVFASTTNGSRAEEVTFHQNGRQRTVAGRIVTEAADGGLLLEADVDAYADAWALNYYLTKYEPDAYAAYLKSLAKKRPLLEDDRATRLAEFRQHFGDLRRLQQEFLQQMSRVK